MPLGVARRRGSSGENICHIDSIRMRVIGTGNLRLSLHSLQNVRSQVCPNPILMAAVTDIEPTRGFNFLSQRMALKVQTTEIDEFFRINRIIIFAREVFTSYPG